MKNVLNKMICIILALSMMSSLMSFAVSAEGEGIATITAIKGNNGEITLTFNTTLGISPEDARRYIELADEAGSSVDYDLEVSETELVIEPTTDFENDKPYTLNISKDFGWDAVKLAEDYSKLFKIETIWETDFTDTSKGVNDFFMKGWMQPSGGGYPEPNAVIKDGKLYIEAVSNSTLWITDEKIKSAENFTLEFDMAHYGADTDGLPWGILFNVERMKGNAPTATSAPNYQWQYHMGFGFRTGTHATNMWGVGGTGLIGYYVNDKNYVGVVSSTCTGKTWTPANKGDSLTFANSDVTPSAVPSTEHFKFVKEGKVISMYKEGELIYTYDTTDEATTSYANANRTNFPSSTAPSAGYIALSQGHYNDKTSNNQGFVYSDMKVSKLTVRDYKTGDLVATGGNLEGDKESFKVKFSDNIETAENVKTYLKVSTPAGDMDYDYLISGDTIIIYPADGLVADVRYTVTVLPGFGYDAYTVKNETIGEYEFISREGVITVEELKGTDKNIYITFNCDMGETTESLIKEKIKISLNGENVNYSVNIDAETVTLTLPESIQRDKIYDLLIKEGLGFEKVTVKNDILKYFIVETVKNITFDEGTISDYISTSRIGDAKDESSIPYATVRNGKLYVEDNDYSTVFFKNLGIENLEDYVVKFEIEHYGRAANDYILFNVPTTASGVIVYGWGVKGFGWYVKNSGWSRIMQWSRTNAGQRIYYGETNPGGAVGGYLEGNLVIDGNDGEVQLPSGEPVVTKYMIEKQGTKADFTVNGILVDTFETKGVIEEWNSANQSNAITDELHTKGTLVYGTLRGAANNASKKASVAFTGIEVCQFKEYTDGGIKVVENYAGNITLRNFNEEESYVKLYAVETTANNKMTGAKVLVDEKLGLGAVKNSNFTFDPEKTQLLQIDSTNADLYRTIKIEEISKKDFENNIITIKGTIEKSNTDKIVPLFAVKEGTDLKTVTEFQNGLIALIPVKAGETEFEYDFEYDDQNDKLYTLEVYTLSGISDSADYELKAKYNYAEKNETLNYIDSLKTTKTTLEELNKYAQSLGSDITFIQNESPNVKDILISGIYEEKDNILSGQPQTAIDVIASAKAKVLLIKTLKNDVINTVEVKKALTDYAQKANLDLTAFDELGEKQTSVLNKFIKADYEQKGWAVFATDFNNAVANASIPTPPSGGGGGGGGATGGATFAPVVTVEPEETPSKEPVINNKGFTDMENHIWAKEAVEALRDKGVITGIGGNLFDPDGIVTREQFAKMAVIAFEMYNGDAKANFADVNEHDWSYAYIASAKENGLMLGDAENNFMGTNAITREDLCVILYRATIAKGRVYSEKKNSFSDMGNINDYALEAVEYMAGAGIINGFEDGSFKPEIPATRAQAAKLIYAVTGGEGK